MGNDTGAADQKYDTANPDQLMIFYLFHDLWSIVPV